MSEYLDFASPLDSYHIDHNFGREYDPYPQNRRPRQASWISNGAPYGMAGSTPRIPTTNVTSPGMSPVPEVRRMDRSMDIEGMRSPISSHAVASPRPAMPGVSRFREIDQVEPSRWTSPTNVSFPASLVSGVPPRTRADTLSTFAPAQASTPAPERQECYPENVPRYTGGYGVADEESFSRTEYREQNEMQDRELYYDEYAEEDEREEEEEEEEEEEGFEAVTIPDDAGEDEATQHYEIQGDLKVKNKGGKRRNFVGGFMLGLRNVPKLMSRSQPQPAAVDPAHFAPQVNKAPQPPFISSPPRRESPARSMSPPRTSHVPSYAQEDSTQSSNTSSQMVLTPTPSQTGDLQLPNPHESRIGTPGIVNEPEQADMLPASDYDAMTPPIHTIDPFETTMSSQVDRVGKAISNFIHLPWIGPYVSESYSPLTSRRARYKDVKKTGVSWYTKEIQEKVDLLAAYPPLQPRPHPVARPRQDNTPGPSRERDNRAARARRSPSRDAATAMRPTRTPRSITGAGAAHQSPGASSHGHGHHSYSYNYHYPAHTQGMPVSQPIILYPGPSPLMVPNSAPDGTRSPSSSRPDSQQQPPQFMYYTAPATFIVPTSPDAHPRRPGSRQYHPQFPMPIIMTPPVQTVPTPTPTASPPQRATSPRAVPVSQPIPATSPRQQGTRHLQEKNSHASSS